jgi:hypothetical protein
MNRFRPVVAVLMTAFLVHLPVATWAGPGSAPGGGRLGHGLLGMALLLIVAMAVKTGWLALALLGAVLWPDRCRRGVGVAERRFGRCFLTGLLLLVAYLLLGWLAFRLPLPWRRLATVPLMVGFMLHALAGFVVLANALGERIEANLGGSGGSTLRAVLLGGGVLVLLGFFPLLGQLADFILVAASLGIVLQPFPRISPPA